LAVDVGAAVPSPSGSAGAFAPRAVLGLAAGRRAAAHRVDVGVQLQFGANDVDHRLAARAFGQDQQLEFFQLVTDPLLTPR
jgi:hypothetical protein